MSPPRFLASFHMLVHYLLALAAGVLSFVLLGSFWWAVFAVFVALALDVDHLFDFWLVEREVAARSHRAVFGWVRDLIGESGTGSYFHRSGKIVVFLHSWELLIIVWGVSWILGVWEPAIAFSLGFLPHMLWDQITFARRPLMYFFTFRALQRFRLDKICVDHECP